MTFVADYLLKDVYMRKTSEDIVFLSRAKGQHAYYLPIIKDSGTLSSGFFLLYNPLHVQVSPGPLFVTLWELGLGEQEQMLILWYYYLLWAIQSFVSALGVLCLLPTSTKLWHGT